MSRCCLVEVITVIEIQSVPNSAMPHLTDRPYYKVQTQVENPTRYHIQQAQRYQVKQYLTIDTKLPNQTLTLTHPQVTGATHVVQNGHVPPDTEIGITENPITKLLALGKDHENVMDDVFENIISMESSFNDKGTGCPEDPLLMQRTLSGSILDVYNGDQGISPVNMGLTNASCPRSLPVKRETPVERRRRYNINYRIKELGTLIPKSNDPDMRWNKGTILKASVEYIKWLQKEQQRARELEHRQKKLELVNRQLLLRIQELEIQARAHGLPISSSQGAIDLVALTTNHQTYPEDKSGDYSQEVTLAQGSRSDLCDGSVAFSYPLSHFTDLSFSAALKEEQRLDHILLDDSISPFGTDPLLSATSPTVSKDSSRRSSFSTDDGDEL
ncbi:transcription factor EC isoform X4 [Petaurus breviceps papuanus]|uniref:transcription factor EC isoform X4 n=1 Tax=Petaurus breviceps papuanus TaxID=3040969 RepID=UPI0036DAF863